VPESGGFAWRYTVRVAELHLSVAHTSELDPAVLRAARAMLDDAFDGDFSDEDWEHALGGMHALLSEGDAPIAHAAVVQRRLLNGGRALRAGYVEAVGVRADHRRGGHGGTVMAAVERVLRGGFEVGALAASEMALNFYAARGWQRWRGSLSSLTPDGVVETPGEAIFVLPVCASFDLDGELTCDWRDGDVW